MSDNEQECVNPIDTIKELYDYQAPSWATNTNICPLYDAKWSVMTAPDRCHVNIENWIAPPRHLRDSVPRTLVCHDMRGGYLEDKYVAGYDCVNPYNFYHWNVIDIFVYFSHHFVTIPPLGWINAGHKHGVQVLGTILVENEDGAKLLSEVLQNHTTVKYFVDAIISITSSLHLDGWLLNVEVQTNQVENLKQLVGMLKRALHELNSKNLLIWYDSVIISGELKWQNELNNYNKIFFDLSDGIFLNYNWTKEKLKNSKLLCGSRNLDVYVGIDVFARGCTGEMRSHESVRIAQSYGFSSAIFAPGWTHETLAQTPANTCEMRYRMKDQTFWRTFASAVYEHVIGDVFTTAFHTGYLRGKFNLSKQHMPVNTTQLGPAELVGLVEAAPSTSRLLEALRPREESVCNCISVREGRLQLSAITLREEEKGMRVVYRLITCDIFIKSQIIIGVVYQITGPRPDLALLCRKPNGKTIVVVPQEMDVQSQIPEQDTLLSKNFESQFELGQEWGMRCYVITRAGTRVLEIGFLLPNPGKVIIGGITLQNYPLKRVTRPLQVSPNKCAASS